MPPIVNKKGNKQATIKKRGKGNSAHGTKFSQTCSMYEQLEEKIKSAKGIEQVDRHLEEVIRSKLSFEEKMKLIKLYVERCKTLNVL